jgi:hypothetical protein
MKTKEDVMKKTVMFACWIALLSACGTLHPSEPADMTPTDPVQPQVIDNVTNGRLVKILPAPGNRFFAVGTIQNPNNQQSVFIRRFFVDANGLGLDTTFGANGQVVLGLPGSAEQVHDAVFLQEGADQQILLVGSTLLGGIRIPMITRVNTLQPGIFTRLLGGFPGEEARAVDLTNQNPARVVVGLQGAADNQVRVIRLLREAPAGELILDTLFSGDGSQLITIPAPNILGLNRVQVQDLQVTANNIIMLTGNGFAPDPLGGENAVPFAARVSALLPPLVQVAVTTNIPLDRVSALGVDANNRLVLAGERSNANGVPELAVARLNNNLGVDNTFNNSGANSTSFQSVFQPGIGQQTLPSQGLDVNIDAAGRIVVAGRTDLPGFGLPIGGQAMALARFLPTGALDITFGQAGRITRIENGFSTVAQSLELFAQGRMVAGGTATNLLGGTAVSLQRFVEP